jgi:hypothetical protein
MPTSTYLTLKMITEFSASGQAKGVSLNTVPLIFFGWIKRIKLALKFRAHRFLL